MGGPGSVERAISIIQAREAEMPTYDYRCPDCGRRASIFQRYVDYGRVPVACPHCGGRRLERRIGRVRVARSEEARLETLSDPGEWGGVDEDDPRSVARMMRRMGSEMGEELPEEFNDVVDRLEAGESPEEIEKDMPDLGGGAAGGDDFED
jgi:putative FmdB family regulatory protein